MNALAFVNDISPELARSAHLQTSFTPEVRSKQERDTYAGTLAEDFANLAELITPEKEHLRPVLESEFARYREGYRVRFQKKLASAARCASWMITGPANFPVARMEKRNRVAHKRLEEMLEFRERALSAIRKTLCPELRPIMSGDADALQRLQAEIEEREKRQAHMKLVNSTIRKHLKADKAGKMAALLAVGLTQAQAVAALTPNCFGGIGFESFELTNNNANIKRMKDRHVAISRNQSTPASEAIGANASVEDCPADNRVRLTFPGKPSVEVRTKLKSSGFRWTPSLGVWQAYRHNHTIALAREIAGV